MVMVVGWVKHWTAWSASLNKNVCLNETWKLPYSRVLCSQHHTCCRHGADWSHPPWWRQRPSVSVSSSRCYMQRKITVPETRAEPGQPAFTVLLTGANKGVGHEWWAMSIIFSCHVLYDTFNSLDVSQLNRKTNRQSKAGRRHFEWKKIMVKPEMLSLKLLSLGCM